MASDPFRALLEAARASIEAALALYDPPKPVPDGPCAHPSDQRLEAPVAGAAKQFFCKACDTLINPEAPEPPLGGA